MKIDNLNINFAGNEITLRKTELEPKGVLKKLGETYSEFAKLVFLFDVSGSMASTIEGYGSPTRIEMVRRLAHQEITARFKKFPDSRIAVIQFGSSAQTVFDDGEPDAVWSELEKLNANGPLSGNTDIMAAIRKGIAVCREKPSPIGVHHFIIVTDGGDWGTYALESWLPALKSSGVVLDYIHIGKDDGSYGGANEALKNACIELAGEFVTVDSVKALEEKFLAAVNRPLLLEAGK